MHAGVRCSCEAVSLARCKLGGEALLLSCSAADMVQAGVADLETSRD